MAMNIPNNHEQDQYGLNEEDLKQFGIVVEETPEEIEARNKPESVPKDEVLSLIEKNRRDQDQQIAMLQSQLAAERRSVAPTQQATPAPTITTKVPVSVDENNVPYIDATQIAPMLGQAFSEYHQNTVQPHEALLKDLSTNKHITDAVALIKQRDPSILAGQDEKEIGGLALGLYNSPTNTGRNEQEKSEYVFSKLKDMSLKSGNPSLSRERVPSNQVGRTEGGAESQMPYPKGKTINIDRTTASEMGFENFMASIDKERQLQEMSDRYDMGWKFNVRRPKGME